MNTGPGRDDVIPTPLLLACLVFYGLRAIAAPSRAAASFSARAARALASAARRRSICAGSVIGLRVRFGLASASVNG